MFGMTEKDADNIAVGISHCHKLRHISLRNSKVVFVYTVYSMSLKMRPMLIYILRVSNSLTPGD